MASKKNGQDFTGKLGDSVMYYLNNKLVKRKIGYPTGIPQLRQLASREPMKLINNFITPLREFIDVGYALRAKRKQLNTHNAMVKTCLPAIIKGDYPDQEIDYSNAILAKGKMPLPLQLSAAFSSGKLVFTWDTQLINELTKVDDHAMLVAYCPAKDLAYYVIHGPQRSEGRAELVLAIADEPVIWETYIAFIADNHKKISNSAYLGQVVVQKEI